MLKYGNRDFRNLQEQVYANMKNIEDIIKGSDITMDYKLNIVAQVAKATDLPDADTYEGNYGDIYIVGEAAPLNAYVFGKVYENENAPSWIELGEIFVEGPQGPKGEQGDAAGFAEPTVSTSTLAAGSPATVSIVASGPDTAKEFAFTFGIPKGEKGDTGPQGPQGPQGEPGSGTSVSDFVEGTGIVISSAADDKVEIAVDENKVLVAPEIAPAAQQLVSINTSGEQNALTAGDGLVIEDNELKVNCLVLAGTGQTVSKAEITEAQYNKILAKGYHYIYMTNNQNGINLMFVPEAQGARYRSTIYKTGGSAGAMSGGTSNSLEYYDGIASQNSQSSTGYYFTTSKMTWDAVKYSNIGLLGSSGTLNSTDNSNLSNGMLLEHLTTYAVDSGSQRQRAIVNWEFIDSQTYKIAVGKALIYDSTGATATTYKIVVNLKSGAWTATAQ